MKQLILLVLCVSCALGGKSTVKPLTLVSEGTSRYAIVLSHAATASDSVAAGELQRHLKEISGADLRIVNDRVPASKFEVVIGATARTRPAWFSSITRDGGFSIRTRGSRLFFAGKGETGVINGVYSFLEQELGCRKYSASVKIVPKRRTVIVSGKIDRTENPVFTHRSINSWELDDPEYRRWHKDLKQNESDPQWGLFVHTFHTLVPPERYFKEHPEYFALRNGLRVKEQLCLSNPDVFTIVVRELRRRMKLKPEATLWSVSQNDNVAYCQCPDCAAIDAREEAQSGSILEFVNKVAREFPEKTISTLAYLYSRKAPRTIRPEKNVNIMLCTIECMRTLPLETDTIRNGFVRDMKDWCRLTDNIFLWDYVVQFTGLVSPFPNLHVLQPNIQFFARYKTQMQFQQGQGRNPGCEFSELRTYLIAKLLWNPDVNIDSVMNDFLSGYYGKAAAPIRSYIDLMRDSLIASGGNLWIYDNPVVEMKTFLTPGLMKRYSRLFDEAESAVRSEPEYLARVRAARLPLMYAALEQAKVIGEGEDGIVLRSGSGFAVNPKIESLLAEFRDGCRRVGAVNVNEKALSVE
ncbi:MAG TPA: DUF4838 domain-containing protein, partial [Bacteroidota bacterium]|nr:DUF4838 domain-containing protein [Bacteroidota bacterium]